MQKLPPRRVSFRLTVLLFCLSLAWAPGLASGTEHDDETTLGTMLAQAPTFAAPCAAIDVEPDELLEKDRYQQFNILVKHFVRAEMAAADVSACLQVLMGLVSWATERPIDTYRGVADKAFDVVCEKVKRLTGVEQCLPGTVEPMSMSDDVTMFIPDAFYDSRLDRHYALARWDWNAQPDRNPGGDDGIAISIEDVEAVREGYFYAEPDRGRDCNEGESRQPSERGYITMSFEIDECRRYSIFSKLGHSYETTGVSSISIGAPPNISITFSDQQFQWEAVSPDVYRYPPRDYGST